jgi:lysophospholipase L1-like esterase
MNRTLALFCLLAAAANSSAEFLVFNRGIPGQNSQEGRARFEQDVISAHPQFVLIYFGLNDALNEPKFLPLASFIANLAWMVDQAREHHITPVLCTIQHADSARLLLRHKKESYGTEGPNGKIDRFNSSIRELAMTKKTLLADFQSALDQAGGPSPRFSTDGIHLTPLGNQLLAKSFYDVIPSLRSPQTIVCFGDSVTYGVGMNGAGTAAGETYPAVLQRLLQKRTGQKRRPPSHS